jgi:branched-chain amino acid aminotransferase
MKVYVDGEIVDGAEARVPVTDRGLLYGDGVFEVLRTTNGRPFLLDRHLDRLAGGAAAIGLALPAPTVIATAVGRTIVALGEEARVRIVVTRGDASLERRLSDVGTPRLLVMAEPLRLPPPEVYERGIRLATVSRRMPTPDALDPRIKALSYLDRVLALDEARRVGADEAIRLDAGGRVAECATANLFFVAHGALLTPPANAALAGVTRSIVLEDAAAADIPIGERAPLPAELAAADEVFVTSAVKGIVPVGVLDGVSRLPGTVTRQLIARYRARLEHG